VQKQNSICYLSENKMVRQFLLRRTNSTRFIGWHAGPPSLKEVLSSDPPSQWGKKADNDQTKMFLVKLK